MLRLLVARVASVSTRALSEHVRALQALQSPIAVAQCVAPAPELCEVFCTVKLTFVFAGVYG